MTRRWTFLVVSEHENRAPQQFSISERQIKAAASAVLLLLLVVSATLSILFTRSQVTQHTRALQMENKLLAEQVAQQRKQFADVQSILSELQKRDEAFRLMAGLEPLGSAVYTAGIGGSSGSTAARSIARVDAELGDMVAANALDLDAIARRALILRNSWEQAVSTLQMKYEQLAATPSILPTIGYLSSSFSRHRWHPILDENRPHAGIDIAAPRGTPIQAAARARVAFVGPRGQYGLMIELDHGHGYVTRYAHLASASVRVGEMVARRAEIGTVGESGLAIGPHLHYEVLHNGVARNPIGFIFDRGAIPD